jgi:predicted phage terminase large subunit-like protein
MNLLSIDNIIIERVLAARSLKDYILLAWPQVEPARDFIDNWHLDVLTEHLEAVTRGELTRLVINVPPGTMKSLSCCVFWPSWSWIAEPQLKWITAAYSGLISRRDALRARRLMESRWYQERWGHLWEPNEDDWSSIRYSNSKAGLRLATTPGGAGTGEHADIQLVDDPIKPMDASGARADSASLAACIEWWDETMASRVTDPATARRVIIMQRLHDRDLSAHALNAGYDHLCLPMVATRKCVVKVQHPCSMAQNAKGEETPPTALGYKDERKPRELLWEKRFPLKVVKARRKEFGSRAWAAQDQQRPSPAGGNIFKRDWVQYWRSIPRRRVEIIQSWDCAFKGLDDSDYVVGSVWLRKDADYYLLDQVRDRMSVSGTCKAILSLSAKWKKARKKLIEDKANGPAVITLLKKKVPGLIAVNPQGGKVARAHAVEPLWESKNVWLPDPTLPGKAWVHDFIEEVVSFNGDPGREDDQVDGMTQALIYLHAKTAAQYKKAMEQL